MDVQVEGITQRGKVGIKVETDMKREESRRFELVAEEESQSTGKGGKSK